MRVVIADDLTIARMQAFRILSHLGEEVVALCVNGQEAVDACATETPDLVLLDISMPVLTGMQAAEIIHRDGTARHIVVVSSQSQAGILKPLQAMGARFCLKPYDHRQLQALITAIKASET